MSAGFGGYREHWAGTAIDDGVQGLLSGFMVTSLSSTGRGSVRNRTSHGRHHDHEAAEGKIAKNVGPGTTIPRTFEDPLHPAFRGDFGPKRAMTFLAKNLSPL